MLETYFKRKSTWTTYYAGPAGPYLDAFSHWLEERGFTTQPIRRYLFGAAQFATWAEANGIAIQHLDTVILDAFRHYLAKYDQLRTHTGHPTARCLGAQHFLSFLSTQGIVSVAAATPAMPASRSCLSMLGADP